MSKKISRIKSALQSLLYGEISEADFATELYDIDNMLFKSSSIANAIYDGEASFKNCYLLYREYMEFLE